MGGCERTTKKYSNGAKNTNYYKFESADRVGGCWRVLCRQPLTLNPLRWERKDGALETEWSHRQHENALRLTQ